MNLLINECTKNILTKIWKRHIENNMEIFCEKGKGVPKTFY